MNCPKCNITLLMTDRQGIEIDYCPQCRGIWLDRGELEKIIELSPARNPAMDQPQGFPPMGYSDYHHDKHDDHDNHGSQHGYGGAYGHRRKKGFLGELFDF
ncbi:MAG: zf-TFIIB domain-containing protein [Bacteroidetes bacterium]|nr:zf-TFIIB domain-containing protein [Bacteroidota bacterium]